jgi:hypothetical protein
LKELSPQLERLYSTTGRPSIAPEKLLRALLLQALYGKRSERLLMEELDYSLLFRWFVGLGIDDEVWDATVFSKNRDRLIEGENCQWLFRGGARAAGAVGVAERRTFYGGRDHAGSVGEPAEFPGKGGAAPARERTAGQAFAAGHA